MNANRVWTIAWTLLTIPVISTQAATISQTFNGSRDFHLHQFDPAAGTLTSVSAELIGQGLVAGGFSYFPPPPEDPRFPIELGFAIAHTDGGFVRVSHPDLDLTIQLISTPQQWFLYPEETNLLPVESSGVGTTSTSDVSAFVGTDGVNFSFSGSPGYLLVDPGPFVYFEGITEEFVGGSFTLTYHYTPVPEPSTLVLAGGAVLGLLLVARRRGV